MLTPQEVAVHQAGGLALIFGTGRIAFGNLISLQGIRGIHKQSAVLAFPACYPLNNFY